MPTFVARQQPHRGMVHRSKPTRREPGLLDSIVDPIVSDVVEPVASKVVAPVVNKVADSVVDPVVNNVVKPVATPLLNVASSVVAPIVAPLIQGGNTAPTQATQPPPPPPANTPPPSTVPPGGSSGGGSGGEAGNGGNGGNGGNSGNGNGTGHSGGGNNGNGHSGGNENGNSGGGNNGSGDSGGNENGNSGGSENGSSGGDGNGSGTGGGSESGSTNGNGGGTGGDDESEAGPVNNSSNGGVPGDGVNNSEGASGIGSGSGQTPTGTGDPAASSGSDFLTTGGNVPVNAGGDPNAAAPDSSTSGQGDNSVTGSTAFNPGPSGSGISGTEGSGNGGSGVGGGMTNGAGATSGQKGGLSGGAIAGIVVGVLLVIAIVLILLIRRQRKRSKARRQQSWFARNGASPVYNDGTRFDTVIGHNGVRRSVRSSFETTVDHSQTPRLELDFEQVPNLPPMAQLRGDPVLVNLDTPAPGPQDAVTSHSSPSMARRFSTGTASSSGGGCDGSQWLTVNPRMGPGGGQNSPMSVRLSSPIEAFAFPRPPTDVSGSDYSSLTIASPTAKSGIQDMPGLPVPSLSVNPFDDPSPSVASDSAGSGKTRKIPKPINVAAANPFADPLPDHPVEPNTPSAVHPEFQEVEMIKRPFVPTLSDEVMVEVGDRVKILQMFDDGWSLVEKKPVLSADSKDTDKSPQVGLIPIDCLRSVGLDVNEFIASKRVSSYSATSSRRGTLEAAGSTGLAF